MIYPIKSEFSYILLKSLAFHLLFNSFPPLCFESRNLFSYICPATFLLTKVTNQCILSIMTVNWSCSWRIANLSIRTVLGKQNKNKLSQRTKENKFTLECLLTNAPTLLELPTCLYPRPPVSPSHTRLLALQSTPASCSCYYTIYTSRTPPAPSVSLSSCQLFILLYKCWTFNH